MRIDELIGVMKDGYQGKCISFKDDEGVTCVKFGPLFYLYQDISDTLVGILMRAKKYKRISYPGDMLFQGKDDEVIIRLINDTPMVQ